VRPPGRARFQTQILAAPARQDLKKAISAGAAVKNELGI